MRFTGVIVVLTVISLFGCATTKMYTGSYAEGGVAKLVGGKGKYGVIVDSFDDKKFFVFTFFYGAKIECLPGNHTVVIHWEYAGMSLKDSQGRNVALKLQFSAEAGHTYAVNWLGTMVQYSGANITDTATGAVVSF